MGVEGGVPCAGTSRPARRWSALVALAATLAAASAGAQEGALPAIEGADAPLKPPELLQDSPASYPEELKAQALEGDVELELVIDATGAVSELTVVTGVHPLFDAAALEAARALRFQPASLGGEPVAVRMRFVYRFLAPQPAPPPPPPEPLPVRREGTIAGLVRSRGNRIPIAGASVGDPAGPSTETDAEGRFRLKLPTEGRVRLSVRAAGFRDRAFEEELAPDESVEVVYALDPVRVNPYETIVRADRPRTEVSRVSLERQELREVPGTMGDPFRVVMLMPGVGSMLSGAAYPVVRGASPAATGYFLDGVRVPMLFHLFLGPAVIHPDFIEGLDFYPGAPPAQYGRVLGGAIEGRLTRPRDDRLHGSAYLDLINAGGFVEYPFESTGTHVSVAGRYSYTPWLLALTANSRAGEGDSRYVLDFWDYQGRVEQKLLGGRLRLFAFGSSDQVGTESSDADATAMMQSVLFHRVDLRYRRPLLGGELEAGGTWGLDGIGMRSQGLGGGRTDFDLDEMSWKARLGWTADLGRGFELRLGGDFEHRKAQVTLGGEVGYTGRPIDIDQPVAVGTFVGSWGELVWRGRGWTVVPGLRLDSYHLVPEVQHWAVEPRLTVRKELAEAFSLKGAAGLYHQAPSTLINMPVVDVAALTYGLQEAAQVDVGFEWRIIKGLELTFDAYVNPLLRTVEINPFDRHQMSAAQPTPFDTHRIPGAGEIFDADKLASRGWSYGLEVMLRHPLGGRWFGWIAYSLQRSTRYATFTRYGDNGEIVGEDSGYLPYAFDQTHILNAVLSYQLPRGFTVGAAFHLNTGRPEAGAMTSSTLREGTVADRPAWVQVSRDEADRLPTFFRVDVRLAKSWTFDSFVLDAYLDMLNASFTSETVAYTYGGGLYRGGGALRKSALGLPVILPILGVKGTY